MPASNSSSPTRRRSRSPEAEPSAGEAREGASVVEVTTRGGPFADASSAVIRRRASKMLEHLGLRGVEICVALVDDATIRELNSSFRQKDKPTDVLSFPLHERPKRWKPRDARGEEIGAGWPHAGPLGDVIVSVETARRQAAAQRRPLLAEITMLLAHGVLHLLGYDHRDDAEDREMTARTRELEAAAVARQARESRSI
jgi:probable rRNA maturation factor